MLLDPEFHTKLYLILNNKSIKQESWKKRAIFTCMYDLIYTVSIKTFYTYIQREQMVREIHPPPPSSSQFAGRIITPETVKVLRPERQSTCWLHSTGDSVFLWKTLGFLFPPYAVWPSTGGSGLADSAHHLLVMWKHIQIQLRRMYTAALRRSLWRSGLSGRAYVSTPRGSHLRQRAKKYDITASGGGMGD